MNTKTAAVSINTNVWSFYSHPTKLHFKKEKSTFSIPDCFFMPLWLFLFSGKSTAESEYHAATSSSSNHHSKPQNKHWRKKFRPQERTVPSYLTVARRSLLLILAKNISKKEMGSCTFLFLANIKTKDTCQILHGARQDIVEWFSVGIMAELCNKPLTWHQSEDSPKENVKPRSWQREMRGLQTRKSPLMFLVWLLLELKSASRKPKVWNVRTQGQTLQGAARKPPESNLTQESFG